MNDKKRKLTYASPVSGISVTLSGTPYSNVYEDGEGPRRKILTIAELRERCTKMDLTTGLQRAFSN